MAHLPKLISILAGRMQACLSPRFRHTYALICAAASAASGQGGVWLPHIYRFAVQQAGPAPESQQPDVTDWEKDLPRRQIVRQLKETLMKSTILVGVGHCIEASFALGTALVDGDKETVFVRENFDSDGQAYARGTFGLDRVYKQNNAPIQQRMLSLGLRDIQWLGPAVTYGQLLASTRPENPRASLTFAETEIIVLTCLIARHAHREVLWHLRGCLRAGMSADEVEGCQQAVELCLQMLATTADSSHKPMPRVTDVEEEDVLP